MFNFALMGCLPLLGDVPPPAGVAPAAPLMTWASTSSDNTPDFDIDLPSGAGDGTDAAAGDVLHIQYQASGGDWSTPSEYVSYTLLSGDITADTITESGSAVADGNYDFRARLERSGIGNSAWTADVAVTISTATTATLNPADVGSTVTLSGGNLIATSTGSAGPTVRATNSQTTGKRYYEATVNTFAATEIHIGICTAAHPLTQVLVDTGFGDAYPDATALRLADQVYSYRTNTPNGSGYFGGGAGTVVGVLADLDAQTLSVTQNGTTYSTPVSFANIAAGTALFPALSLSTSTNEVTCNFGATAYTYSAPTGATNW